METDEGVIVMKALNILNLRAKHYQISATIGITLSIALNFKTADTTKPVPQRTYRTTDPQIPLIDLRKYVQHYFRSSNQNRHEPNTNCQLTQ